MGPGPPAPGPIESLLLENHLTAKAEPRRQERRKVMGRFDNRTVIVTGVPAE